MKTTYFTNPTTLEELKAQYKKLAFKYHPDCGGDTETMQKINAEYDALHAELKFKHRNAQGEEYTSKSRTEWGGTDEAPEEFRDLIDKLIHIPGITVELCGSWLWVTGNTRDVKDDLKALGFRFSSNKSAWYYHRDGYRKHGKSTKTMDEIRTMYGSQAYSTGRREERDEITA